MLADHLKPLTEPTPSGITRLLAAWGGLSIESHIAILHHLSASEMAPYLSERAYRRALESPNPYVRYLAAKALDPREGSEIRGLIDNDPAPLVRTSTREGSWWVTKFEDPRDFFALDQDARLAEVRDLNDQGDKLAEIIKYGVEHEVPAGRLSELEVLEVLHDYIGDGRLKEELARERGYDGWAEYSAGKDLGDLWKLVPILPSKASYLLASSLPVAAGLNHRALEDVFEDLSDEQKECVLYRSDVELMAARKRIYDETDNSDRRDSGLRVAAISHNFDVTNEEFDRILASSNEDKLRLLKELAMYSTDLRICVYQAIRDALLHVDFGDADSLGGAFEDAYYARISQARREEKLEGSGWGREQVELAVYETAKASVPWKRDEAGYKPTGKLAFLAEGVVENDPWATFCKMWQLWEEKGRGLERSLLEGDPGDDSGPVSPEVAGEAVKARLDDAIDRLAENADEQTRQLSAVLREMSGQNDALSEYVLGTDRDVRKRLAGIESTLRWISALIALIALWLLWTLS